jgi:hypothetical protein
MAKTEEAIESIACIIHEMNRRWHQLLGDDSVIPWDDMPNDEAETILVAVRAALEDIPKTPEDQHIAWMLYKEVQGWKYGPQKDPVQRTHPCMVPYNELPPTQQIKDKFFVAIVEALR